MDINLYIHMISSRKKCLKVSLENFYKHFNKNSDILHAGCGGGEVDKFIVKNFNITAVDISSRALDLYNKINPNVIVKKSNIFNMNLDKKKFDGIYNLGVIEHFNAKKFLYPMCN